VLRGGERGLRAWRYRFCAALLTLCAGAAAAGPSLRDSLSPVTGQIAAPALSLARIDGKSYALAQRRGRVVMVNFWATWCPPCRAEMPAMERLWQRLHGRGLDVVGVNQGESAQAISAFLKDFGTPISFPILLDSDSKALDDWSVRGLPATFIVDKRGRVRYTALGGREMDSTHIVGLINGLLAE